MKAIALISGGLDSILAAKVIQQQGIEVIPLHCIIPFGHRRKRWQGRRPERSWQVREYLGQALREADIREEFLGLLCNPRHGFGSGMNPCIDCKILMLRKAAGLMREWGAAFLVSGEVVGQRPMSQLRNTLSLIAREAGVEGLLVRPLSGRLLEETIPEKEGWIKREKLLGFSGRGRSDQILLAQTLGVREYAQPAGGCLLTEKGFSNRLKDLLAHTELSLRTVEIIKIGRHFRLSAQAVLAVGRDEQENASLLELAGTGEYIFSPAGDLAGPTALGRGVFDDALLQAACRVVCRYCDRNGAPGAEIAYRKTGETLELVSRVEPLGEVELDALRL